MAPFLARIWDAYLVVLEGTGASARLASLPLPIAPSARALAVTLAGVSILLLVYSALEAGPDPRVRALRAATLLLALALPLGALRIPPAARAPYGGAALVLLVVAALLHASLRRRRRAGAAERALGAARLVCEALGLAFFVWGAARLALGDPVPLRLAFWSLFLLRISVADLLQPAALVLSSGLPESAVSDLKRAAGSSARRRKPGPGARAGSALAGAAKGVLVFAWLALPLAAAAAPAAVARGLWPPEALWLRFYPPFALGATAALLLVRSLRLLPTAPLRGGRGAVVAAASLLYLLFSFRDPAFAAYRRHLPGILLAESLAGVLLGASSRKRR